MGNKLKTPEKQAFRILWKSLFAGANISDDELQLMHEPLDPAKPRDPPDFQFSHEGKSVAVEHTQVFRWEQLAGAAGNPPFSPLLNLAIQERVCRHLDELLKEVPKELPTIHVSIKFASCHEVKGREQERAIVRGLLQLVCKRLESGESVPIELYMFDLRHISSSLADVIVYAGGTSSTANRSALARVDEWGLPSFETASTMKGKALASYKDRGAYDEYWLLLHGGGADPSQWIEPSSNACSTGIMSNFDRVFYVTVDTERVYIIHVTGSDGPSATI